MKFLLLAMMFLQQGVPPITTQVPVTRPVLSCPTGYILWKSSYYFTQQGTNGMVIHYEWYKAEGQYPEGYENPTCFKDGYDPNSKEKTK
jgi:hypothetical protein